MKLNKYCISLSVFVCFMNIRATYNGFDMSQDMPQDNFPLSPDRIYTPAQEPVIVTAILTRQIRRAWFIRGAKKKCIRYIRYADIRQKNKDLYPWRFKRAA